MTALQTRLNALKSRVAAACVSAGRAPTAASLVVATKYAKPAAICELLAAGPLIIGESRVQDAIPKAKLLAAANTQSNFDLHFIGHLQTNKLAALLPWVSMLHSLDSLKLAHALARKLTVLEKTLPVLLQVNVTGEASKFGFTPAELRQALEELSRLPQLSISGLMTMAPLQASAGDLNACFTEVAQLKSDLAALAQKFAYANMNFKELSMGMSQDFEAAIAAGATFVRIGRAVFTP